MHAPMVQSNEFGYGYGYGSRSDASFPTAHPGGLTREKSLATSIGGYGDETEMGSIGMPVPAPSNGTPIPSALQAGQYR